jgi:presenilin-like A22 family membrane protease
MKPYLQIALFFAITQLLGIYAGVMLVESMKTNPDIASFSVAPIENMNDPMNALIFIGYIIFAAVMIILLARFYKGMLGFRLVEAMVIFSASSIVFFTVFFPLLSSDAAITFLIKYWPESFGFATLSERAFVFAILFGSGVALLLAASKFFFDSVKNTAAVISSAGVGALFGFSLGFIPTIIFTIGLSLYDYIAVFKTKHMIEMARELSSRQLSFAISAKSVPARKPKEKAEVYVDRAMKEGERLDLGTGDISVPLMLAVSAYQSPMLGPNGIIYALAISAGSTLSLIYLLRFVSSKRVFLPALPPICLGGMLGLLIVKLAGF